MTDTVIILLCSVQRLKDSMLAKKGLVMTEKLDS